MPEPESVDNTKTVNKKSTFREVIQELDPEALELWDGHSYEVSVPETIDEPSSFNIFLYNSNGDIIIVELEIGIKKTITVDSPMRNIRSGFNS